MTAQHAFHNITLVVPRPSSGKDPHSPLLVNSIIPVVLPDNHVVIRIDRFGFSSNNITYQALGEIPHFRYFDFHLAPGCEKTHGVIPTWGYGTIVASNISHILVNERVMGYFSMSRYLIVPVDVSDINEYNFHVPRPHLPPDRRPYNQITRCSRDKLYYPKHEDLSMIYRPLFWTSFWAEDWLFNQPSSPYNGVNTILISSASAKTAFCLAYLLKKRNHSAVNVVGLTSRDNFTFTKDLGLYHTVLTYDEVEARLMPSDRTWIYVDVAGNDTLNRRIRETLGTLLKRTISLGMTNLAPSVQDTYFLPASGVSEAPTGTDRSNPPVEFFFMPEWLAEKRRSLTASAIFTMQHVAWTDLMRDCRTWVTIERFWGSENIQKGYIEAVKGRIKPEIAMVWSLWNQEEGERWEREVIATSKNVSIKL